MQLDCGGKKMTKYTLTGGACSTDDIITTTIKNPIIGQYTL